LTSHTSMNHWPGVDKRDDQISNGKGVERIFYAWSPGKRLAWQATPSGGDSDRSCSFAFAGASIHLMQLNRAIK
jgi:hypothetical protein